jgi:hypothetical protein
VAPRAVIFLPIAFLVHLGEEWSADLSAWTRTALGAEITFQRFVIVNAIALPIVVAGTVASLRYPRVAWFGASLAALFGLNAVVHTLATIGLGQYSPGTISGLVLYMPLCMVILRSSMARLSHGVLVRSVMFGFALHGVVSLAAFL